MNENILKNLTEAAVCFPDRSISPDSNCDADVS